MNPRTLPYFLSRVDNTYKTKSVKHLPALLALALIAAFSILMLTKVVPYFSFERGMRFLSTKTDRVLDNAFFMVGFYVHITSSVWVLAGGLLQFIPAMLRNKPEWHQKVGKLYVLSVLLLAAPSGMVLAFYANGGLAAKVGFAMQCVVWWLITHLAWKEATQKRWTRHIEWMIRSYAVTLAAMSLRGESYLMHHWLETKPIETYLTVTWLSWTGNLLLAEVAIRWGLASYFSRITTKKKATTSIF